MPQPQEPQALPELTSKEVHDIYLSWLMAPGTNEHDLILIGLAFEAGARAALATPQDVSPPPEPVAREDARQLKLHAAGLTYNDTTAEGEAKHRLHEIAMRIETGYYNRATPPGPAKPPTCRESDGRCGICGCQGMLNRPAAPPSAPASEPTGPMETRGLKDGYASADNEPRDPERDAYLDYRGDDKGQGLDAYWKWGHAAGWNDHKKHAATSAPAEPLSDKEIDDLACEWVYIRPGCEAEDYQSLREFARAVLAKQGGAS